MANSQLGPSFFHARARSQCERSFFFFLFSFFNNPVSVLSESMRRTVKRRSFYTDLNNINSCGTEIAFSPTLITFNVFSCHFLAKSFTVAFTKTIVLKLICSKALVMLARQTLKCMVCIIKIWIVAYSSSRDLISLAAMICGKIPRPRKSGPQIVFCSSFSRRNQVQLATHACHVGYKNSHGASLAIISYLTLAE